MNSSNSIQKFAVKSSQVSPKKFVNNAVIYTRVSSGDQAKYGKGLEWQLEDCQEYCKKNGYNIIKEFGDKAESAKTDEDRVQFQKMLDFLKKNKEFIGHVVVWNMDRFSRSGELMILEMLGKMEIRLHCVKHTFDSTTVAGKFEMNLFAIISKWENEQRQEKTVRGMQNKLRSGELITKPPIGYEKRILVKDGPALCFIDERGKLIRQAFLWAAEGNVTQTEIITRLANMGLKLSSPQLSRILRNPFYCGLITNKLLNEGEMIQGKHEPLISEKIFLKVNGILADNPQGWKIKKEMEEMPLKKFTHCGNCGRRLSCYQRKQKYFYYKCPNKGCCVNLRNTNLHDLFIEKIKQLNIKPELLPALHIQLSTVYWNLHESDLLREKPLKDEMAKLKKDFDAIEYNYSTGKIPVEIYNKHTAPLQHRIMSIQEDLDKITRNNSNFENNLRSTLENSCNLHQIWEMMDYTGKQRLQYLIYPLGMHYYKETDEIRTPEINPVFSAITHLSKELQTSDASEFSEGTEENLRQVYLMFGNSNSIEVAFADAGNTHELNTIIYPYIYESARCPYVDFSTGNTKSIIVKYNSSWTGSGTTWMETYKSDLCTTSLFHKSNGAVFSARTW